MDLVLADHDAGGGRTAAYTLGLGIDDLISVRTNGQEYYYVRDRLGSIVGLVDENGHVVNRYRYGSYGELVEQNEQIPKRYTYAGRELDRATGLYFNRARYYSPDLKRFPSPDALGIEADKNPYAYARGNPVAFVDRLGLTGQDPEQGPAIRHMQHAVFGEPVVDPQAVDAA